MGKEDRAARVVVTGLGAISPLGVGVEDTWSAAVAGVSGCAAITLFDTSDSATTIACEARGFDPLDFMDGRSARRMERFAQFGVAAATLALADSGLRMEGSLPDRSGAIIGTGIGGLHALEVQGEIMTKRGPGRLSPLFIPLMLGNMGAAQVSMRLGLRGPVSCVSTACASGNHAIGDAAAIVRRGEADIMFAGGAEATVARIGVGAFNATRALSTRNDDPQGASRPFDAERDGFVMGEGAGVLLLENLDHARRRGASIYCEILGYGASADAYHLTDPDPSGEAPAAAMTLAMDRAGVAPESVDYVNAHGTATPIGDPNEVKVLRMALGEAIAAQTPVSSTKSMHGHCLGAAGGIEGVLTVKVIVEGWIPPTINLVDVDEACTGVDHVANVARDQDVNIAISNGFGFGGHNAVIVMGRREDL